MKANQSSQLMNRQLNLPLNIKDYEKTDRSLNLIVDLLTIINND